MPSPDGMNDPSGVGVPAATDPGQETPSDLPLAPMDPSVPEPGTTPTTPTPPAEPVNDGPLPLVFDVENTGADCPAPPAQPAFGALTPIANLPDPFLLFDGTRMTRRDQWRCRRSEIGSMLQFWGTGPKGAPPSANNLTASLAGNTLTVVVNQNGASLTLTGTLTRPNGPGPFPLVIGMNSPTGSLPGNLFAGVATLTFNASQLVPNAFGVPRAAGTYFTMYPDRNTGAMIEWAWGVSRLIDGLYLTAGQNNIDLKHVGVTGCSFAGKMALYAGAFDERIALVIAQESGGGGEASWRFMATQTQIEQENLEEAQGTAWYAENLLQFKNNATKLPYDMHELAAMVAPRAILAIQNTQVARLGAEAGSVSMRAAAEVYEALGISDRIGFSQASNMHCAFPNVQGPDVQAFVDKFLKGNTAANTNIAKSSYNTNLTTWITWTTPTLQ